LVQQTAGGKAQQLPAARGMIALFAATTRPCLAGYRLSNTRSTERRKNICYIYAIYHSDRCSSPARYSRVGRNSCSFRNSQVSIREVNAVCRLRLSICFTAIARAFLLPIKTQSCLALVRPV
jgi:hypothetical protein